MFTRTTTELLDSLRDPQNAVLWSAFDERYRPIITAFAIRKGLSDADAADAAQLALSEFAALYSDGVYNRDRGRLRSWLIGIALRRIAAVRRALPRACSASPESLDAIECEPDPDTDAAWSEAVRRSILDRALASLRCESRFDERTINAFELTALRGVPAVEAADQCGMSTSEVYVAKNRVIAKLREITARLTKELDCE